MIKNLMFYETCVKRECLNTQMTWNVNNTACLFYMQLIMHAADIQIKWIWDTLCTANMITCPYNN